MQSRISKLVKGTNPTQQQGTYKLHDQADILRPTKHKDTSGWVGPGYVTDPEVPGMPGMVAVRWQ